MDTEAHTTNDDGALFHEIISHGSLGGGEPRTTEYIGTKGLMLAVLEDGIRDYCGCLGRQRTDAESWVHSNRRAVFSFIVICEVLGLDPGAVRQALERLQAHAKGPLRRIRPEVQKKRAVIGPRRSPAKNVAA